MTKPKYEELSSEQVNDLIATKVMGYRRSNFPNSFYNTDRDVDGFSFSPYFDLNDCWLAEEKLTDEQRGEYVRTLVSINEFAAHNWKQVFPFLHATAAQRCKAILMVLGEIGE